MYAVWIYYGRKLPEVESHTNGGKCTCVIPIIQFVYDRDKTKNPRVQGLTVVPYPITTTTTTTKTRLDANSFDLNLCQDKRFSSLLFILLSFMVKDIQITGLAFFFSTRDATKTIIIVQAVLFPLNNAFLSGCTRTFRIKFIVKTLNRGVQAGN